MHRIIPTTVLLAATLVPITAAEGMRRGPAIDEPGREWRLSIAVGSHNVTWPLRIVSPPHPAVLTCVETPIARTRLGEVPLRLVAGGFSDRDFNLDAALFMLESGQRVRFRGRLRPEASVMLGYMGSRDTRRGFRQASGGAWRSVRGDVQSSLVFGAGVSVELALPGHSWLSGIRLGYRWLAQTPYIRNEYSLNAHGVWSIGATLPIRSGGRAGR
jgi:hypothetical protein